MDGLCVPRRRRGGAAGSLGPSTPAAAPALPLRAVPETPACRRRTGPSHRV